MPPHHPMLHKRSYYTSSQHLSERVAEHIQNLNRIYLPPTSAAGPLAVSTIRIHIMDIA